MIVASHRVPPPGQHLYCDGCDMVWINLDSPGDGPWADAICCEDCRDLIRLDDDGCRPFVKPYRKLDWSPYVETYEDYLNDNAVF